MVSLTGLSQAFGNTSNPQHLMPFHSHSAALRLLSETPKEGRNIRVLIGEPGVGKTMLMLHLLEQFRPSARICHLFWTQLGRSEFLSYFLSQVGVSRPAVDLGEAQRQLTALLEREFRQGRKVIVAIDEGHNLEIAALRGLAELLDCSTARNTDLQVVLAGLPRLTSKLSSRELRGFSGRISEITSLSPLTVDETASYIRRKLELSGYRGASPFTPDAISTIASLSEGIPRNINNICSAGLFLAAKRSGIAINATTVIEAEAQWGGRPVVLQETAQELLPLPGNLVALEPETQPAAQTSPQLHTYEKRPPQPVHSKSYAAAVPSDTGPSPEPAGSRALPHRIRHWFGGQRLAWSGTVGELAAALNEPETELVGALHASADVLLSLGVAASLRESVGRTRSVTLRRVDESPPTGAELSKSESSREAELAAWATATSGSSATENPSKDAHAKTRPAEEIENEQEDAASPSPTDQLLGLVRANEQRRAGKHASRFRRIFSAFLTLLVISVSAWAGPTVWL